MKTLSIALLVLTVLLLPTVAVAGPDAGDSAKVSKDDGRAVIGMMLIPAAILLLALPAAVVFRAGVRLPDRIADTLTERPVVSVLLGVANVILFVLLATAGQVSPLIAGVAGFLWILLLLVALVGLCGSATKLARRMSERNGLGAFALAWLAISGVSLLPVLGLVYVLWLVSGAIGGTLLTLYAARPVTASEAPPTPDA